MESNLVQGKYFSPDQVLVGGIQPNLILGACLGAEFVFPPDKDSDIAGRPLEGVRDAADLPAAAVLLEHPLIRRLDHRRREGVARAWRQGNPRRRDARVAGGTGDGTPPFRQPFEPAPPRLFARAAKRVVYCVLSDRSVIVVSTSVSSCRSPL
jgi:hypothetical protein